MWLWFGEMGGGNGGEKRRRGGGGEKVLARGGGRHGLADGVGQLPMVVRAVEGGGIGFRKRRE